jgi:hypothetical protein
MASPLGSRRVLSMGWSVKSISGKENLSYAS